MSYFLYLSVPRKVITELRGAFDSSIRIIDATDTPIGNMVRGRQSWPVYILMIGIDSSNLVGRGAILDKSRKRLDRSQLLVEGVQSLLANDNCVFVTLLLHWMSGDWTKERISLSGETHIPLKDLVRSATELEEDVLYIVEEDVPHVQNR